MSDGDDDTARPASFSQSRPRNMRTKGNSNFSIGYCRRHNRPISSNTVEASVIVRSIVV